MKNYFTLPKNFNRISFWERIGLLFHKTYVSFDFGIQNKDRSCAMFYKIMKGKVYILKEELLPEIKITSNKEGE